MRVLHWETILGLLLLVSAGNLFGQTTDWIHPYSLDVNTVALWHFDEASGNLVADASPNGYNGTTMNVTNVSGRRGFSRAKQFLADPIGSVDLGNFNLPAAEGTFEAWIRPLPRPSLEANHSHFFVKGTDGNSGAGFTFYIRIYDDGRLDAGTGDNGSDLNTMTLPGVVTFSGEWQHIAFTWSQQASIFYVNGAIVASGPPFTIGQSSQKVSLGKWGSMMYPECRYIGDIDEIRISNVARTYKMSATTVSIAADFNGTAIPAGSTIWFNSICKPSGLGTDIVNLYVMNSTISYALNGQTTTLTVPGSHLRFDPAASEATTQFVGGAWETVVPSFFTNNVFLTGLANPVAAGLPGGIKQVTWTAEIGTDKPALSLQWKWAAAVYTGFGNYGNIGVKPIDGEQANPYANSDHAGTPEAFKEFVTGGARGGGGSNWTGGYSGTLAVTFGAPLPKLARNEPEKVPTAYQLLQNYPNPFNPSTIIQYALPSPSHVRLAVYTMLGQQVRELLNGAVGAGYHEVTFNAAALSSGAYFYRLEAAGHVLVKSMAVMK